MRIAMYLMDLSLAVLSFYLSYSAVISLLRFGRLPRAEMQGNCKRISIIIPARNEEGKIGRALKSVLQNLGDKDEVIVVDDCSQDRTFDEALISCDERCILIKVLQKPDGWSGKSWACYQGYLHSKGEAILFLDADTEVKGDIRGPCHLLSEYDAISQVPWIKCETLGCGSIEVAFTSLLRLTFPYWKMEREKAWLAGAFMLWRRSSYERAGTHWSVRSSPVEDAELGRRAAYMGMKISFFRGRVAQSYWINSWHEGLPTLTRIMMARAPRLRHAVLVFLILVYIFLITCLSPVLSLMGYLNPILTLTYLATVFSYAALSFMEIDANPLSLVFAPLGLPILALSLLRASLGKSVEWKGRIVKAGSE